MKSTIGSAISLLLRVLNILFRLDPRGLQLRTDAVCAESHFLPDILAALLVRRYLIQVAEDDIMRYYQVFSRGLLNLSAWA
jgi:hypothetical protein